MKPLLLAGLFFSPVQQHLDFQTCDRDGWKNIIETHLATYPAMEVVDLYKLIHQGVYGAEHAVPSRREAASWLRDEVASLGARLGGPEPAVEAIAPNHEVVRVHLRPYVRDGRDVNALLDAFVSTALESRGSLELFRCVVDVASGVDARGWTPEEWASFSESQIESGVGAVHHSEAFGAAYSPSYRVIAGEHLPPVGGGRQGDELPG